MLDRNTYPTILSARLAIDRLSKKGLLITTGAAHTYNNVAPDMLSYALSKNIVHNLNMIVANDETLIQKQADVICILPTVIDTISNRQNMPDEDFEQWLSPEKVAELIFMWSESSNRPNSGAFVQLNTKDGMVVPLIC